MNTNTLTKFGFTLILAATLFSWSAPAMATTFTFSDEYFLGQNKNYDPPFTGVTGKTPNTSHGYFWQETDTVNKTMTQMGYTSLAGEYVVNTNQELALFGWSATTASASTPATSVFNLNNPINGNNTYFQYTVGGTKTPFLFNGFDLAGGFSGTNLTFTLEGFLGGNMVDSAILTVTGNTFNTYTLNWQNVDTVEIVSTASLPLNWGSNAIVMDNVEINDPVTAPTPEPASLLLMGLGIAGAAAARRRITRNGA
uniref:PEP-CTERM putative exosortase interaction domain-containing protein n=1 Tax=Desulfovibrio sp. U5L TaxID=596152 RepID=I2PWE6_9BACT